MYVLESSKCVFSLQSNKSDKDVQLMYSCQLYTNGALRPASIICIILFLFIFKGSMQFKHLLAWITC